MNSFKVPIFISREKFYIVYRLSIRKRGSVVNRWLYAFLTDTDGYTYKNAVVSFPYIHIDMQGLNERQKEENFKDFYDRFKSFVAVFVESFSRRNSRKIVKISGFDDIPFFVSACDGIQSVLKIKDVDPALFSFKYLSLYKQKEKMDVHKKFVVSFNKKIKVLSTKEMYLLYEFKLPFARIKNNLWTADYRRGIIVTLLEMYKKRNGYYFIPYGSMTMENDDIDKVMLTYLQYLSGYMNFKALNSFVLNVYKTMGLNVKEVVDSFNRRETNRIMNRKGYLKGHFIKEGSLSFLRCVPYYRIDYVDGSKAVVEDRDISGTIKDFLSDSNVSYKEGKKRIVEVENNNISI